MLVRNQSLIFFVLVISVFLNFYQFKNNPTPQVCRGDCSKVAEWDEESLDVNGIMTRNNVPIVEHYQEIKRFVVYKMTPGLKAPAYCAESETSVQGAIVIHNLATTAKCKVKLFDPVRMRAILEFRGLQVYVDKEEVTWKSPDNQGGGFIAVQRAK